MSSPGLVVAALRWADPHAEVDMVSGAVHVDERAAGPTEADRCALEYALRLAESGGGRCVAVTAAPAGADWMLRDALAAGAAAVLRLDLPAGDPVEAVVDDGGAVAVALIDAVTERHGRPDVVLCGDYSTDRGTGSTPARMAEALGGAQALGLVDVVTAAGGAGLHATRRLDGGRRERLAVPLPAVCSVEATDARLRDPGLDATLAALQAEIPVAPAVPTGDPRLRLASVRPYRPRPRAVRAPVAEDPLARLLAVTGAVPQRPPARVVEPATPAAAVDELLGYLREHGYAPG